MAKQPVYPVPRIIYDSSVDEGIDCSKEPSMTQQQFKNECDVNLILKKFTETGLMPHTREEALGSFGDFTQVEDYQSSLNKVIEAQEAFMTLSAEIRKRFSNSPQAFLEFVADPKNIDEGIKLGIFTLPKGYKVPQPAPKEPTAAPAGNAAGGSPPAGGKGA